MTAREPRRATRAQLSRSDFEEELAIARKEKRAPELRGFAKDVDLSGLDLTSPYKSPYGPHSAVYIGINLSGANMRNCNLERCDFANAELGAADLSGSNLRGANLYGVRFAFATLNGANLSGSNLLEALFFQTSLVNTVFRNASFGYTTIVDTDLSSTIDLAAVDHHRPSAIDSPSLRLTASRLADEPEFRRQDFFRFLSGGGLDEEFIPIVRTWIGQPVEYHSLFISHSSFDKDFARKIYRDLRALGVSCWLDEKEILPGDYILEEVDRGIKLWDRLLLVCSRNSLGPTTGWWVEQELERALAKERDFRRSGIQAGTLVPVTIDDYVFTEWQSQYRATVLERKIGDFRGADTQAYANSLNKLVTALNRDRR